MLVIFFPDFDLTNSLLTKMPVGRVNFLPLGAVRSIVRSDMVESMAVKQRCCRGDKRVAEGGERSRSSGRARLNIKDTH